MISYEYLLRVPRWALDLLAGCVLLTFGSFFLITGLLSHVSIARLVPWGLGQISKNETSSFSNHHKYVALS